MKRFFLIILILILLAGCTFYNDDKMPDATSFTNNEIKDVKRSDNRNEESLKNISSLAKIYYDYLISLRDIETEGSPTTGGNFVNWNVNDLYYYLDDFNNDGIIDLAISAEESDSNGIEVYTYKNGQVEKLISKCMPYSAGTEIFTLAKYDDMYGIKYVRLNSIGEFSFSCINNDGTIETIFEGYIYDSDGNVLDTSNSYDKIKPVTFYSIGELERMSLENSELSPSITSETSLVEVQTWQDMYAKLLMESGSKKFSLCDIDVDGIPELLVGGSPADTAKYADYDVYIYKNNTIKCLGSVYTLSEDSFSLDNNGGILGYSYGAGEGGTHRYYIDDGVLCDDGEVYGYRYDENGDYIQWFRGSDGSDVIVTEETQEEYQNISNNGIELEKYDINEVNITKVIYGIKK